MKYNFLNDAIRWQMSQSTNVIFTVLVFANVRAVRTKVKGRQTETDNPVAVGEILQIFFKKWIFCNVSFVSPGHKYSS